MDDGSILPYIIIILLFVLAAYFALAETAYSSVSRLRLKTRADKGDRAARRALKILDSFDKTITTVLIGTNITHIAASSIAAVLALRVWGASGVTLCTVVITLLVFFIGEMLPKSAAKKYSERLCLSVAPSLSFFILIFTPVSFLLTKIGSLASKLSRDEPELTVTEDELIDIVETMREEGEISEKRGDLLGAALAFSDVTAEDILTARVDVAALDITAARDEIIAAIKLHKHSRLPVYRENIDNVVGVLQIRKYIKAWLNSPGHAELSSLLDEPYFIHRGAKVADLLPELSRVKANLAIVTDSYGGTLGIVTVEDILEELVGEIWDEDDEVVEDFTALPDGAFELDASLSVADALEKMGFPGADDPGFERKLLVDWVCEQFDRIPSVGDSFRFGALRVTVAQKHKNRITKLHARILAPEDEREGEK
jgi:Mg2+/Co2+ transporter CorB